MRTRTRAKNEIQAVLARRLQSKPPFADLFGVKGRHWLAGLELPIEARESVDAGLRQIAFIDTEIAAVDRLIAQQALAWPEIRRLMTVPGVNLICAASFLAAIGEPSRFLTSRKLVAYLGLDPKVRQSGEAPARSGRISKRRPDAPNKSAVCCIGRERRLHETGVSRSLAGRLFRSLFVERRRPSHRGGWDAMPEIIATA
ncbi:MAG: transposase [Solirubrobacteraceae bacterium]